MNGETFTIYKRNNQYHLQIVSYSSNDYNDCLARAKSLLNDSYKRYATSIFVLYKKSDHWHFGYKSKAFQDVESLIESLSLFFDVDWDKVFIKTV